MWNKQRKDEVLIDVEDVALGHEARMRRNDHEKWIFSDNIVHTPLVDAETFDRVQQIMAAKGAGRVNRVRRRTIHRYVLRGLLVCGICHRRMQGQQRRQELFYRCRYPNEYGLANKVEHPRNVYLAERHLLGPLDEWLCRCLAPHRVEETIEAMYQAQPYDDVDPAAAVAARAVDECDRALARHRAALEAGADPHLVTGWITETQARRAEAVARAKPAVRSQRMTKEEIRALAGQVGDLRKVLADADPADKAEVYERLGLQAVYNPGKQTVRVEISLGSNWWGYGTCPRRFVCTIHPPPATGVAQPALAMPPQVRKHPAINTRTKTLPTQGAHDAPTSGSFWQTPGDLADGRSDVLTMSGHFLVNSRPTLPGNVRIGQGAVVSRTESNPERELGSQVTNSIDGDVQGPVVLAGAIYGGVNLAPAAATTASAVPVPYPNTRSEELFVGRREQVRQLVRWLDPQIEGSGTVVVSAVQGMGGIGKTALARYTTQLAVARGWFPGGAVWADLRGYDPDPAKAATPELLYAPVLRSLGVPGEKIPATPSEQLTVYHQHLQHLANQRRWALIVLDNAAATAQLDGLLPNGAGWRHRVLITSRDTLVLPGSSTRIEVGVFTPSEAQLLWRGVLCQHNERDPRLADTHVTVTEQVLAACGWLPLAIQIAAGIATDEADLDLADLAAELRDQTGRLDTLTDDLDGVCGVIRTSWTRLCRRDPSTAKLLALLALHPGPDLDLHAAAAIADQPAASTRTRLRVLTRSHLLAAAQTGATADSGPITHGSPPSAGSASGVAVGQRWRFHDLVLAFLRRHAGADLAIPGAEQNAIVQRLLDHYSILTATAVNYLRPVADQSRFDQFTSRYHALAWLDTERAVLAATVALAYGTARWRTTTALVADLGVYLAWRRLFPDWISLCETALRAADHLTPAAQAMASNNLGLALQKVRRFDEAITAHTEAVCVYRKIGDRYGEGSALGNVGVDLLQMRRWEDAITTQHQVVDILREVGDRHGEGIAWNNLGLALQEVGRFEEAIAALTTTAEIFRETEDLHGEAGVLTNLGTTLRKVDRIEEAIAAHTQAVEIYGQTGDRHGEGQALDNLGASLRPVGRFEEAITAHTTAADIFRETADRHGEGNALDNLGASLQDVDRFEEAITAHTTAADIFRETGDRHGEGNALGNLGIALREMERFKEAIAAHTEAVDIHRQTGDRHGEGHALGNLGIALWEMGQGKQAGKAWRQAMEVFTQTGDHETAQLFHGLLDAME